ncbi:MAG: hypothetical protein H6807_03105 [Planctomycetes bacterium]|nr:hypothetical protein [Planctomycetota bacterium]
MDSYDARPPKQSNTLGLLGFILSLTCCLAPLGLVFSLIGLAKAPRGFAIAGLLISLLITGAGGFGYFKLDRFAGENGLESAAKLCEYFFDTLKFNAALDQHMKSVGTLPGSAEELNLDKDAKTDPWGQAYRLRFRSIEFQDGNRLAVYALESAGQDGSWGTDDDIVERADKKFFAPVGCQIPVTLKEGPDGQPLPELPTPKVPADQGDDENK